MQWSKQSPVTDSTILCGDFNQVADSLGYQYLLANPYGMKNTTSGGHIAGWENSTTGQRIDYVLLNKNSPLKVKQSQRIFTEKVFGRVSDHLGIYTQFVKKEQ